MVINGVNFDDVTDEAIQAVKLAVSDSTDEIIDIVKNIGDSLKGDIAFVAKKKLNDEFDEDDAKVFMEDQKIVARMRLRSVAIITLRTAEIIWNAIVGVFNAAINRAIGWTIL